MYDKNPKPREPKNQTISKVDPFGSLGSEVRGFCLLDPLEKPTRHGTSEEERELRAKLEEEAWPMLSVTLRWQVAGKSLATSRSQNLS